MPQLLRVRLEYPLGDQVVFAGALRELHRCHPGEFEVVVESSLTEFWAHSPHARGIRPSDSARDEADGSKPAGQIRFDGGEGLYAGVNERPRHMLQAFVELLNARLGTHVSVGQFRGDAHLTPAEREAPGPVECLVGRQVPYWIVCNGGKFDRTVKWWPSESYQRVVTSFRDRVAFVQVGRSLDFHPRLRGALDFRGWTSVRSLLRLVYWAEGVLCPITSLMHLAAAVPRPPGRDGPRPCVVVGGGIEPPHWTAYPGHRFLSTVGALPCTSDGCWKSRTLTLGDGAAQDGPEHRCLDVERLHPRCLRLIRPIDVTRAIETYLSGGTASGLSAPEAEAVRIALPIQRGTALDDRSFQRQTARLAIERQAGLSRRVRFTGEGRGLVTLAHGLDYVASAWVMAQLQRRLGCRLPMEVWLMGDPHWLAPLREAFAPLHARVRFHPAPVDPRAPRSSLFAAKPEVLAKSHFLEVLWLDADSFPARDPSDLFDLPPYLEHGAVCWPELDGYASTTPEAWRMFGLSEDSASPEVQGGELLFNRARVAPSLHLARWFNRHYAQTYAVVQGDKDTFRLAFRKMGQTYAMPAHRPTLRDGCLFQCDFAGRPLFQHRVAAKIAVGRPWTPVTGFEHAAECANDLEEFTATVASRLAARTPKAPAISRTIPIAMRTVSATASPARLREIPSGPSLSRGPRLPRWR